MPSGLLSRHFGSQPVIMSAGILTIVGSIATSYANDLAILYFTHGVLIGSTVSLAAVNSISTVATWFDKYRNIAAGLSSCGSGLGQLVSPIIAGRLLETDGGDNWRAANRYLGLGCGILLTISGFFVRTRPPDNKTPASGKVVEMANTNAKLSESLESLPGNSEDVSMSLKPPHSSSSSAERTPEGSSLQKNESAAKTSSTVAASISRMFDPVRGAIKTPYYRYFLLYAMCVMLPFNIPLIHLPAWVEDAGESESRAAVVLSVLGGAQVVGRIVHGLFADKYGTLNGITIGIFLLGVFSLMWPTITYSYTWGLAFTIIYGVNVGVLTTHAPALIAEYFHGDPAPLVGLYFTIGAPMGLIGPASAGFIFDAYGSYFGAAFLTGVPFFIGQIFLFQMRRIRNAERKAETMSSDSDKSASSDNDTTTSFIVQKTTSSNIDEGTSSDADKTSLKVEDLTSSLSVSDNHGELNNGEKTNAPAGERTEQSKSTKQSEASESSLVKAHEGNV